MDPVHETTGMDACQRSNHCIGYEVLSSMDTVNVRRQISSNEFIILRPVTDHYATRHSRGLDGDILMNDPWDPDGPIGETSGDASD